MPTFCPLGLGKVVEAQQIRPVFLEPGCCYLTECFGLSNAICYSAFRYEVAGIFRRITLLAHDVEPRNDTRVNAKGHAQRANRDKVMSGNAGAGSVAVRVEPDVS
jgi:hypothetical protein